MRHTAAIMRRALLALVVASCAVSLVACSKKAEPPAPAGIAWVQAAGDAEVDAAFARAKAEGKPVFVYWGAKWCPPCNQLKATLFNRQDFIERSRAFVPVYVDGDQPGAQKLGTRFAVRGYPTTIVFTHEGRELTRLPGEVDAAQYNEVLALPHAPAGKASPTPTGGCSPGTRGRPTSSSSSANMACRRCCASWRRPARRRRPTRRCACA